MKSDNTVVFVIGVILMLVAAWFGATAFFGLVGDLYTWLDSHIWAFFAGIIAFFLSLWIVGLMLQITVVVLALILGVLSTLFG